MCICLFSALVPLSLTFSKMLTVSLLYHIFNVYILFLLPLHTHKYLLNFIFTFFFITVQSCILRFHLDCLPFYILPTVTIILSWSCNSWFIVSLILHLSNFYFNDFPLHWRKTFSFLCFLLKKFSDLLIFSIPHHGILLSFCFSFI